MGFLDQVKAWLSKEAAEASDVLSNAEDRLDREMTRREQQLSETPSEAMERLQAAGESNQSLLDELGDKIGNRAAKADATAELIEDASDDSIDPDISNGGAG